MKRRRLIIAVLVVVVILVGLFVVVGVPLIQDMFTPPITGLPTTSPGNSLQARFTQTAQAKAAGSTTLGTPRPVSK